MYDIDTPTENSLVLQAITAALWFVWQVVRWPTLALLIVLEPISRVVLAGFALLGTLTAFFFEFVVARPGFPFWGMLAVSLGAFGLLVLYHGLIRALSPR